MIQLCKHAFYDEEKTRELLSQFIKSNNPLTIGYHVDLFEKQFAEWQGSTHAITFNSGSSANLALLQSLKNLGILRERDKIAVSSLTWATNVMPVIQLGFIPCFMDVDMYSMNVSPRTFMECYNKNMDIKCLFITHALGFSDNIQGVKLLCNEYNILLLEDTCESMGSITSNAKLGNWGFASTFSTFVGHHLSTIEGGIICTNNNDLNISLRRVREHGWNRRIQSSKNKLIDSFLDKKLTTEQFMSECYARYSFYESAFNFRSTEIIGFLGCIQLITLNCANKIRQDNYRRMYDVGIKNSDLVTPRLDHMDFISNYAYPVVVKDHDLLKKYINRARENDIEIRPMLGGAIETQPFYQEWHKKHMTGPYPISETANFIWNHGFYLPNHPHLEDWEISKIQDVLRGD